VRHAVDSIGLNEATVQNFGSSHDVMIRLPLKKGVTSAQLSEQVLDALKKKMLLLKCAVLKRLEHKLVKNFMKMAH
jgi:preprotein translocase subunit SecF